LFSQKVPQAVILNEVKDLADWFKTGFFAFAQNDKNYLMDFGKFNLRQFI